MDARIGLEAQVAMRREDARIARKHLIEAQSRPQSPANALALRDARRWDENRLRALEESERILLDFVAVTA